MTPKLKFQIKDLGLLQYFLEIKVTRSKKILFSLQKYVLDQWSHEIIMESSWWTNRDIADQLGSYTIW